MKFVSCMIASLLSVLAVPCLSKDRSAIIDTAYDTRPYLDRLLGPEKGVLVIGRYLARCKQPEHWLRNKRLIDQGLPSDPNSEISEITKRGGAILSIYQFYSNDPSKFRGLKKDGTALPDASCDWKNARSRTVEDEALLDVTAAISQARQLGQHKGSAIYFGVDFQLQTNDAEAQSNVVRYFTVIHEHMRAAEFKIGAYGNGFTLETLKQSKAPTGELGLIDYSWLMASPSFDRTTEMHRELTWNLFQHKVDLEWFGSPTAASKCSWGLPVDTNIQNPYLGFDVGFWLPKAEKSEAFEVSHVRTLSVFDSHRFVCNGDTILRKFATSKTTETADKTVCYEGALKPMDVVVPFATSVRIGEQNTTTQTVQVDVDGDGSWDGWTRRNNLTQDFQQKPAWIDGGAPSNVLCP
ncbi:glycoside hydrolase domain-containing protein [uncultured Tateyamaria sp.]|uniref:glycoside hydrolase domain-containing protein n=1 Tax=uncultured Tateyamaria sp. TaxID=455651 RepID=UPI00260A753C|nr:glycoside hydrolase domain-containing protein [uncultured Tateyamaria sp.]